MAAARRAHRGRLDVARPGRRAAARGHRGREPRRPRSTAGRKVRRSQRTTRGTRTRSSSPARARGDWRDRDEHVGLDLSFLRPERSLRLAAALRPTGCVRARPSPATSPRRARQRLLGPPRPRPPAARHGLVARRGRHARRDSGEQRAYDASGYVRGELGRRTRFVVAGSGGHSAFAAWMAAELGIAITPSPRFDAQLTYRPEQLDYVAAPVRTSCIRSSPICTGRSDPRSMSHSPRSAPPAPTATCSRCSPRSSGGRCHEVGMDPRDRRVYRTA